MAAMARNAMERELDLLFLVNLTRTMGHDFNGVKATEMLNMMRANVARQQALTVGLSDADADAAAAASRISPQTVNRQLRLARQKVQRTNLSGMSLLIETQIAELQADLDDSYATCEMIKEDLATSRRVTQRMTKGSFRKEPDQQRFTAAGDEAMGLLGTLGLGGTAEGERLAQLVAETMRQPPLEPQGLVTVVKDTAASAVFYTRLVAERSQRRDLRQEMRELYYGQEIIQARERHPAIVETSDPVAAREQAVRALSDELGVLVASEQLGAGPWTPEMMKIQRARTTDYLTRVRAVKELDGVAVATGGAGGGFAFRVLALDPETGREEPAVIFPDEP